MKWKKINEQLVYSGYRKLVRKTFKFPDGHTDDFDIYLDGATFCVLAITKQGRVVVFEQYRPGPEKVLKELPGGGIEQGESPEQGIARELLEETGYKGNIEFVGTNWHCGYSTRLRHNFVATECEKVQEPNHDKNEFGKVIELSMEDFRALLRSGELTDAETGYMGLEFLNLL